MSALSSNKINRKASPIKRIKNHHKNGLKSQNHPFIDRRLQADDISRTLPAYFVCDVDERIRVYQNNVEVTEKVISLNSYKTINNLYSIFYENHDSIEINGYKYIVAGASEVEFVMRHCNE